MRADSNTSIIPIGIPLPQSSSKSSATRIHCKIPLADCMPCIPWGQELAGEVVDESCRCAGYLPAFPERIHRVDSMRGETNDSNAGKTFSEASPLNAMENEVCDG